MTMNAATAPRLHPIVAELLRDFRTVDGELRLTPEQFGAWWARLSDVEAEQREGVAVDLAVVAARFRRERPAGTDWAFHALIFFGTELLGDPERIRAALEAQGLTLEPGGERFVAPVELVKQAPPVATGRTRSVDPLLQQSRNRRLR